MKKYRSIVIGLSILIFIRCAEEPVPKAQKYPIFQTSAGKIDESGVTLTLDVLYRGSASIKQFGFLLDTADSFYFNPNWDISFEDELGDKFSTRVSSNLSPDVLYYARAFMILEADTVYGNAVRFTSQGSLVPTISNFFPKSGIDGDTITIIGTNFSTFREDVSISFGDKNGSIVSTTIEEIKVIIPGPLDAGNTTISLTVFDEDVSIEGFIVNSPTIESISPDFGSDGTEVTLTGSFSKVNSYNRVSFYSEGRYIAGGAGIIIENSGYSLKVLTPRTRHVGNATVLIFVNGKSSNSINFVIGPVIQTVSPLEGRHKDTITIKGLGFPSTLQNTEIRLEDSRAQIVSSSTSELKFLVPNITPGKKKLSFVELKPFPLNGIHKEFVYSSPFNVY
ncbi:MAG: IPT/TIG domain-containing protein [Cyclobacteriaceae bacterium]